MTALQQLWRIVAALFRIGQRRAPGVVQAGVGAARTGNRWLAAKLLTAILAVAVWLAAVIATALFAPPAIRGTGVAIAVLLLLFVVLGIAVRRAPLLLAAVAAFPAGRRAMLRLVGVLGMMLLVGVYFVFVPIKNSPDLIIPLFLLAITWLLLKIAKQMRWTRVILMTIMVVTTIAFFFGGTSSSAGGAYPDYNPDASSISRHRYEETRNNHKRDNIPYFDVVMKGDKGDSGIGEFCQEGDVTVPDFWGEWRPYWASNEPDRHFGILHDGSRQSYGPWGANPPSLNDPRFEYKPRTFCLQGRGTLRFEMITDVFGRSFASRPSSPLPMPSPAPTPTATLGESPSCADGGGCKAAK